MLVHFAIDTGILRLSRDTAQSGFAVAELWELLSPDQRRDLVLGCERLRERWERTGVLVHDGLTVGASTLVHKLDELPQELRKRWKELFKHPDRFRCTPAGLPGWSGVSSEVGLASVVPIAKHIELACVLDEAATMQFCIPAEEAAHVIDLELPDRSKKTLEVCRFSAVDRARAFIHAEEAQIPGIIPEGISGEDLWQGYFAPMAKYARQIVVVDRYGAAMGNNLEGLKAAIRRLSATVRNDSRCYLTAYLGYSTPVELPLVRNEIKALAATLPGEGLAKLTLWFVKESAFQRLSHGRYIRFDDRVCIIDLGVELFYEDPRGLWRACQYTPSWSVLTARSFKDQEARLRPSDDRSRFTVDTAPPAGGPPS